MGQVFETEYFGNIFLFSLQMDSSSFLLVVGGSLRFSSNDGSTGGGNASVNVYDLTTRNKLPSMLRRRMNYLPDFIAALKEAYRNPIIAAL